MKYSQHISIGIGTYFIALIPITAWILYRQGLPISELWQNRWGIFRHYWCEIGICFVLCVFGAMMPDIDIKSRSQKIIYAVLVAGDLTLILLKYYKQSAVLGLLAMLPMLTSHRGPFHSILAAVIVPIPFLFIPVMLIGNMDYRQLGVSYYIAFLAGYVSHLVADRGEDKV